MAAGAGSARRSSGAFRFGGSAVAAPRSRGSGSSPAPISSGPRQNGWHVPGPLNRRLLSKGHQRVRLAERLQRQAVNARWHSPPKKSGTSKEMARHNSKGIFTVNQLSYTFRARRPAKRQRQRYPHSYPLQALAIRENKVHVHGEPSLTLSPTQVYLDIEGLPDRRFYYLIGALVVTGQSEECHSFWADDESQQATIFVQLTELLTTISDAKVFHYGNYDVNALESPQALEGAVHLRVRQRARHVEPDGPHQIQCWR
jgi:hypothetical protein